MSDVFNPMALDVAAFAERKGYLGGELAQDSEAVRLTEEFPRLVDEACVPGGLRAVTWRAEGEQRSVPGGSPQAWVHVQASARLMLVCQRCLEPAEVLVEADRWFRFVQDEATAAAEDDEAEEDVLALSRRFDLMTLIEDELLMSVPMVPMHEVCPQAVCTEARDQAFDEAGGDGVNPFATLKAQWPTGKPE